MHHLLTMVFICIFDIEVIKVCIMPCDYGLTWLNEMYSGTVCNRRGEEYESPSSSCSGTDLFGHCEIVTSLLEIKTTSS